MSLFVRVLSACLTTVLLSCYLPPLPNNRPDPPAISGPSEGFVDSTYTFTLLGKDPDSSNIRLRVSWGDADTSEWTEYIHSCETTQMSHAWSEPGTYTARAQAMDWKDSVSEWSKGKALTVAVANLPPETPGVPHCPDRCFVRIPCWFGAVSVDPKGGRAWIRFDWGDGDTSEWGKLRHPGDSVFMSHTWTDPRKTFVVRAQAQDSAGAVSEWSVGLDARPEVPDFPYRVRDSILLPRGAHHLVLSPDGSYLYAPSYDKLMVIRTWDNAVDRVVATGSGMFGVDISPDGAYLYVAGSTENGHLYVISTSDFSTKAVPIGRYPEDLEVSPDGRYVFVTYRSDAIAVVRTADHTVEDTIAVGEWPYGVTFTPDGEFAYVADFWNKNLYVIRIFDRGVLDSVKLDGLPRYLTMRPDGRYVYASNGEERTLWVVDTETNAVVDVPYLQSRSAGGAYLAAALPNSEYLYVTVPHGEPGAVAVLRTFDNEVVAYIPVGSRPSGIAVSPHGDKVYIGDEQDNSITVIGY